jgi:hypothetical protein
LPFKCNLQRYTAVDTLLPPDLGYEVGAVHVDSP